MAKANTRAWECGNFYSAGKCSECGHEKKQGFNETICKLFYYPTYMNGDAELEKELCKACYDKIKK